MVKCKEFTKFIPDNNDKGRIMFGVDDVLMATLLLAAGYTVVEVVDNIRQKINVKDYEMSFMYMHLHVIDTYKKFYESQNPETVQHPHEVHPGGDVVGDLQEAEINDNIQYPKIDQSPEKIEQPPEEIHHHPPEKIDQPPDEVNLAQINLEEQQAEVEALVQKYGCIPLVLAHQHQENLLQQCKSYYSKWTLNRYVNNMFHSFVMKYEPRTEVQYIIFRKAAPELKPIPIRVIRCNAKYAMIGIGDGSNNGYLLKAIDKYDPSIPGTVFSIYGQMKIKEKPPKTQKKSNKKDKAHDKTPFEGESPTHGKVARDNSSEFSEQKADVKKE